MGEDGQPLVEESLCILQDEQLSSKSGPETGSVLLGSRMREEQRSPRHAYGAWGRWCSSGGAGDATGRPGPVMVYAEKRRAEVCIRCLDAGDGSRKGAAGCSTVSRLTDRGGRTGHAEDEDGDTDQDERSEGEGRDTKSASRDTSVDLGRT